MPTNQEARERFYKYYDGPVRPRIVNWAKVCLFDFQEQGRSKEWKEGFNYAMSVMAFWMDFTQSMPQKAGLNSLGMAKSNLLGRLVRGEEVRRRPCPKHHGHICYFGECCDGTGWLANDMEEKYKGDGI